jgi:hypothetical protein
VGFVMCRCVYVWVMNSVLVVVICVTVFTVFCIVCGVFFRIVSFVYVFSYLFCLYCHRVKTQLQLIVIIIIIITSCKELLCRIS